MLEVCLRGGDVASGFGFLRPGHPAFALGWLLKKQSMEACLFATNFSFESSYIHMSLSLAGFALGRSECTSVADGVIAGAGSRKHYCVGACLEGCRSSCP
jgi:hypothetical protein